jgi:hypothetical protein
MLEFSWYQHEVLPSQESLGSLKLLGDQIYPHPLVVSVDATGLYHSIDRGIPAKQSTKIRAQAQPTQRVARLARTTWQSGITTVARARYR